MGHRLQQHASELDAGNLSYKIRAAVAADSREAAFLIYEPMGSLAEFLFGVGQNGDAHAVLERLFAETGNRFSHQFADVLEVDGKIAGLLLAYPGHVLKRLSLPTGRDLLQALGLNGIRQLIRRTRFFKHLKEAQPDEYYIYTVSIHPDFQNRKLGTRLIQHAEDSARAAGLAKCSLGVTIGNDNARRFYEKNGYSVEQTVYTPALEKRIGYRGYYRMVKEFVPLPQTKRRLPRERKQCTERALIVNADDFGLSAAANAAIIRSHREGILTSASLMLNEPATEEAIALARQNPRLGVGLHLTLLCGHSTLPHSKIPDLVNQQNEFCNDPAKVGFRYFFRRHLKEQLRAEITAQFEKFRSTGLLLDHVDSHHHLHAHPTVFRILIESAAQFGITHLRLTCEPFRVHARVAFLGCIRRGSHGFIHWLLAGHARPVLKRMDIRHTGAVFGLLQDANVDENYLERLIPVLPPGISEIYSHPSTDRFKHEMDALISPRIKSIIEQEGIRLIRYQDM